MGAWGSGIFQDDTALDFLDELRADDEPMDMVREALEDAAGASYLEYDAGQSALVSAAIVDAVLNGTSLGSDDEEVRAWVAALDAGEASPLRAIAARACIRVIGASSELQELWSENEEEFPRWRQQIEVLANRLAGSQ
jgi:hypothetical protein